MNGVRGSHFEMSSHIRWVFFRSHREDFHDTERFSHRCGKFRGRPRDVQGFVLFMQFPMNWWRPHYSQLPIIPSKLDGPEMTREQALKCTIELGRGK